MGELVLGAAGAAVAGIPGLGITAFTGFQIGVTLGALLFPPSGPSFDRGRLDEIRIQNAQQGSPIPIMYGRNRTAGTIIWASGLKERSATSSSGGKGGGSVTTTDYSYSTSVAIMVCEGPVSKIRRIWANEQVIYDWRTGGSPTLAAWVDSDKVRIYLGNQTTPDTAIEAAEGVGYVSAHKGMCYVVFEDLQLAEVGNNIPNFNFEVEPDYDDLKEVYENLAGRVGLISGDYDFTALAGKPTRGLMVAARTEGARVMETAARANWFDVVESAGVLKAVPRTGTSVATISADDIGASSSGESRPYVETARIQEVELPREYQVSYNSEAQDFQSFNQIARRVARNSQNQEAVTFPMSLGDQYAKYLADTFLMEAWVSRNAHNFTLPYKWIKLDPADVITVTTEDGRSVKVRILEMNSALLGEIEIKGVTESAAIYVDPGLPAAIPPPSTGGVVAVTGADFIVGETCAPYDEYADVPGLFIAAGRSAPGWSGGEVETDPKIRKVDSYTTRQISNHFSSSIFGFSTMDANGVLGHVGLPTPTIDTTNKVRVTLTAGELASITEDEMIVEGLNLAILGKEIFQFQTATLISGTTYELSNLLRFRRGTDHLFWSQSLTGLPHAQGDPFILINTKVEDFGFSAVEVGIEHNFRIVERGRDYSGGLPSFTDPLTLNGDTRRPYGPCQLAYHRDLGATEDIELSWTRRARTSGELVDYEDAPLDEDVEEYQVEIYTDEMDLLRTYIVTGATTVTYDLADQTTDGVEGAEFQFRVLQLSRYPGIREGHPSQIKFVLTTNEI